MNKENEQDLMEIYLAQAAENRRIALIEYARLCAGRDGATLRESGGSNATVDAIVKFTEFLNWRCSAGTTHGLDARAGLSAAVTMALPDRAVKVEEIVKQAERYASALYEADQVMNSSNGANRGPRAHVESKVEAQRTKAAFGGPGTMVSR